MLHPLPGVGFDPGFLWTELLRQHASQLVGTVRLIRYLMLCPSLLRLRHLRLEPLPPDADEHSLLLSVALDPFDDPVNGAQNHLMVKVR